MKAPNLDAYAALSFLHNEWEPSVPSNQPRWLKYVVHVKLYLYDVFQVAIAKSACQWFRKPPASLPHGNTEWGARLHCPGPNSVRNGVEGRRFDIWLGFKGGFWL